MKTKTMTTDHDGMFMGTAGSQPVPEQSRCSSGRYRIMTMAHLLLYRPYIFYFSYIVSSQHKDSWYMRKLISILHMYTNLCRTTRDLYLDRLESLNISIIKTKRSLNRLHLHRDYYTEVYIYGSEKSLNTQLDNRLVTDVPWLLCH